MSISSTPKTIGQAIAAAKAYTPAKVQVEDTWSTERPIFVHSLAQQIEANGFTNTGRVDRSATRNGSKKYSAIFECYYAPQVGGGKRVFLRKNMGQNKAEKEYRREQRQFKVAEERSYSSYSEEEEEVEEEPSSIEFLGSNVNSFVQGKASAKASSKQ